MLQDFAWLVLGLSKNSITVGYVSIQYIPHWLIDRREFRQKRAMLLPSIDAL